MECLPVLSVLVTLLTFLEHCHCQTSIANNVAEGLLDCYNNTALPGITIANERPPATINLLIEYIRKLEDANPTISTRVLSYLILQRFRQDGISRTDRTVDERFGVPFSSSRTERYKFRILLQYLLPSAQTTLNMGDLTPFERCSLHYLISNTIDDLKRDNESLECSRSSRYTSRIFMRRRRNVREDLENTELINQDVAGGRLAANLGRNVSQCPIESGVVYSQFGTMKAGNVLAGIATGLNQENIQNGLVDNRYASTIIGELCEASLFQANPDVSLGASGGWNSTINPKYFFLQNNNLLQATDAELRGALDGLYLGLKMSNFTSTFSDIRISQLIDMYYSPFEKGVFDSSFKACNRNVLYTTMTSTETMRTQLYNFMPVLNLAAISGVSLSNASFETFSNSGISAFNTYLPKMVTDDFGCRGNTTIERVVTDLLIFIDSSWQFSTIQPVLSYVLNNIDVNRYQTKYTLYGGTSLRNLTQSGTSYLSEFYLRYNETVHSNETSGFDYVTIFQTVENYGYEKLNNNTYTGAESTVVLLVPKTGLTDDQKNILLQRKEVFNRVLPDINFLVLGSGSPSDYSTIVSNTNKNAITLTETTSEESLKMTGQSLVTSIKDVPRAIVNPSCTSQFTGASSTFYIRDYVEPRGANYYRISPNYFYSGGETRNLRIREEGYGTITVCLSRDNSKPDSSSNNCKTLTSEEYVIDITSYCSDYTVSTCPPIYLSITGGNSNNKCNNILCRFPDDLRYAVYMENVGCASGSIIATASALLVFFVFALSRFS
ncbi:unnamed protein product [Ceutorhynchus assimilis]|uniref:Uncharacterized protein n=1 Tax=Ceutorhynchus assimilis TaxID=467358 RepID=A0A9N9QJ96_9CUCU|nr:unnamed protein product [Ceutorhynchus assimilis]